MTAYWCRVLTVPDPPTSRHVEIAFPFPQILVVYPDDHGWFLERYTLAGEYGGDTWHQSLEDAKHQADYEYDSLGEWTEIPDEASDPVQYALASATT